jgi:ATP-dependent RNA helicase DeaD
VPTSPDVYVHRIGRTGRVGRSGRAITFVEPRQARELAAIERHANTRISPWAEGAHVAALPLEESRPRRHRKPHDAARNGRGYRKLIASGGRAAGLAEADLIAAVAATGLDGEAIRNVRLLERFALFEVPAAQAERVADEVDGTPVRGHTLRLELAKG